MNLLPLEPTTKILDLATSEGRERLLLAMGLDAERAGHELRETLDKVATMLDATETQYFSKDGIVVDERTTAAHSVRLRAAEFIRDTLVEVLSPVKHENNVGDTKIQVNIQWGE